MISSLAKVDSHQNSVTRLIHALEKAAYGKRGGEPDIATMQLWFVPAVSIVRRYAALWATKGADDTVPLLARLLPVKRYCRR